MKDQNVDLSRHFLVSVIGQARHVSEGLRVRSVDASVGLNCMNNPY